MWPFLSLEREKFWNGKPIQWKESVCLNHHLKERYPEGPSELLWIAARNQYSLCYIVKTLCYLLDHLGVLILTNKLPIQDFLTWFLDHIKPCPAKGPLNAFLPSGMVIHLLLVWLNSFHFPVISLKPRSTLGCSITLKINLYFSFINVRICIVYFFALKQETLNSIFFDLFLPTKNSADARGCKVESIVTKNLGQIISCLLSYSGETWLWKKKHS